MCAFSGTALNENTVRGDLCCQGVAWAPWQRGSLVGALSGTVRVTGMLCGHCSSHSEETENLRRVEVTAAFSWK